MALIQLILNNRAVHRDRVFRNIIDPLDRDDAYLLRYYRFPRQQLIDICNNLPSLEHPTDRTFPLPPIIQFLAALRFFVSGSFQNVIADALGISQPTVCRCIESVCAALTEDTVTRQFIRFPADVEVTNIKEEFRRIARFVNVIGAIDCTHVAIKSPTIDEATFVNRKGYHSINVQAVCDAKMMVRDLVCRWPGSTHDSFIWRMCSLHEKFQRGVFPQSWLLGDSGYALQPWLQTPVLAPHTDGEARYNTAHARTRTTVERCFGLLKSRFRCLDRSGGSLQYEPRKCCKIIVSCIILHNMAIAARLDLPADERAIDEDDEDDDPINTDATDNRPGAAVRKYIIDNFFS